MLKKNTEEKLGTCSVTVEDLEEYKDTKSYKAYLSKMNSIVGFLRFDYRFEESTVRNSEVVLERLQLPAITKGMIDGSPCRKGSQWRSKSQINEV